MSTLSRPEKITQITNNIYLGGYWYVRYSQNSLLDLLRERGIKYIVNCADEIPFYITLKDDFNYIKFGWDDRSDFKLFPSIEAAENYVNKVVLSGEKVYVHCAMGISRSATLVIFHLMKRNDWTYRQAYKFVNSKRESVNPNPGFSEQLQKYILPNEAK
jgi:hypothetical protein